MIRPGLVYFAEEPALKVSIFAQTLPTGELTLLKPVWVRMHAAEIIEDAGFEVLEASNADEA
jgi:hypothetical protein